VLLAAIGTDPPLHHSPGASPLQRALFAPSVGCLVSLTLGIDPGALSGAYAVLAADGSLFAVDDLPTIADGKLRWTDAPVLLSRLLEIKAGQPMHAVVERQSARPGQGISSTFTSATAFGSLLATLQVAGCSIELVTASAWKAGAGLTKDKQRSLDRARLLFPGASLDRKKDHGRAEAILIAQWRLNRAEKAR
jgi:crossover junction endodeoxyribonuclease RuvC